MTKQISALAKSVQYFSRVLEGVPTTTKGYVAGILAITLWSVNVIVARLYAGSMGAAEITMWRWLVAVCILGPFAIRPMRGAWKLIQARPRFYVRLLVGLAVFRIVLLNSLVYLAGETASAIDMALIGTTGPLFLALLGYILMKKSVSIRQITGYAVTICGVFVLILHGGLTDLQSFHFVIGDAWMLLSAFSFAVYSIILEYKPQEFSSIALLMFSALIGLFLVTPFGLHSVFMRGSLPSWDTMLVMLYLGIFPSVVAFFCWLAALRWLGPTRSGLLYYMLPLLSSVEAVIFLGEDFALSEGIGALCILGGVMFAAHGKDGDNHGAEHARHGVHSL